jgi:divalent metal cation (Fe/Co/Zn/Cd) transporter
MVWVNPSLKGNKGHNHFFRRIANWKKMKIKEFLVLSIGLNSITASIKLIFGIVNSSIFLGMNSLYYLVLCIARIILLKGLQDEVEDNHYNNERSQKKPYHVIGNFIIILGLIYFMISLQMYYSSEANVYTGFIVYLVALVSFSKLGIAIYGVLITKNLHQPIIAAMQVFNFTDALVSLVVTQATLLQLGSNGIENHNIWNAYLGFIISLTIVLTGVFFSRRVLKILE